MEIFIEISPNLNKEVVDVHIDVRRTYLNQTEIRRNHIYAGEISRKKENKKKKTTIRKQNRFIRRRVVTTEIKCK